MIFEITLLVLVLILGYTTWTQMRKVESSQDVISDYEVWIDEFIKRIDNMDDNLKQIDAKGTFEADDEIGVIFTSIKEAVDELNEITEQEL